MITRGIAYILLATFSFAIMNSLAKELSNFHPLQVVFFRAIGTFIFIFPYMLYGKIPVLGTERKWLLMRAITGSLSLIAFFIAVQRIPLGSAISIRYLGPIFGAIFAAQFLKEKINWIQWLSFLIAFSGVIVLKGFDVRIDYISLGLLIFSAFTVGIVFVLLRYLGPKEHPLTIINYFMIACLLLSLFGIEHWRWPILSEWWPVAGIGITGMVGQILMTMAFQTEETSILAPFKYMELVYALIIGYIFFGESYPLLPFLGIVLIVAGMVMNVYGKKRG